jgi:glycosyltransferase involved in cell wall biosynthesis
MRIALFSEVYWPMVSGVGVTLDRLVGRLEARGHAVRVYSADYALPPGVEERAEVHRSTSVPFFLYPDVQWAFPRVSEIVQDVACFRPDVIHVATEFALGVAGLKTSRRLGIPLIASAHTDYQKYARKYGVEWAVRAGWHYLRWFYGQARRVLAPSRIYQDYLQSRGVPHTGLWTRGVDSEVFNAKHRSEEYRRAFGVGPNDLLVTYIGRIAKEKDLPQLMQAWQSIVGRNPDARLVLVGQGPLEAEIARSGLAGVHLAGLKRGRELSIAYGSADLFVFPSQTETFGNSLLEAMAAGLPSLAANAGGVLEFARHGVNALLTGSPEAPTLAAGLERLLADAALRGRLRAGGFQTARQRSWDTIDDALLEDYRGVITGRSTTRAA